MRVDDRKTMEIPAHFNEPTRNRYISTKQSWKKVIKIRVNFLIGNINEKSTRTVAGAQDVKLVKDGEQDIILVTGMLQYGGTFEEIKFTKDVITNVTLNGIGIKKQNTVLTQKYIIENR